VPPHHQHSISIVKHDHHRGTFNPQDVLLEVDSVRKFHVRDAEHSTSGVVNDSLA
jgi:hypothetical protein